MFPLAEADSASLAWGGSHRWPGTQGSWLPEAGTGPGCAPQSMGPCGKHLRVCLKAVVLCIPRDAPRGVQGADGKLETASKSIREGPG